MPVSGFNNDEKLKSAARMPQAALPPGRLGQPPLPASAPGPPVDHLADFFQSRGGDPTATDASDALGQRRIVGAMAQADARPDSSPEPEEQQQNRAGGQLAGVGVIRGAQPSLPRAWAVKPGFVGGSSSSSSAGAGRSALPPPPPMPPKLAAGGSPAQRPRPWRPGASGREVRPGGALGAEPRRRDVRPRGSIGGELAEAADRERSRSIPRLRKPPLPAGQGGRPQLRAAAPPPGSPALGSARAAPRTPPRRPSHLSTEADVQVVDCDDASFDEGTARRGSRASRSEASPLPTELDDGRRRLDNAWEAAAAEAHDDDNDLQVGTGSASPRSSGASSPRRSEDAHVLMHTKPSNIIHLSELCDIRLVDLKAWPRFFDDMQEDIVRECRRFGEVVDVLVDEKALFGSAWVRYRHPEDAADCRKQMDARHFAGRRLIAELHGCDAWPGGHGGGHAPNAWSLLQRGGLSF